MTDPGFVGRVVDGALEATVAGSFSTVGYRLRRHVLPWQELPEGALYHDPLAYMRAQPKTPLTLVAASAAGNAFIAPSS